MIEREGEKDRKIELGVRGCRRETRKHKNTENFQPRKEFHSIITTVLFSYKFLFYRNRRRAVTGDVASR